MESIRIKKDDVYRIEVNDKGEYIEFDLLDIELPMKCLNASRELKKHSNFYKQRIKAIQNQYKDDQELLFINKHKADMDFCRKMREVFDGFLGEGACQKIFGNVNRIGMFDELFEQLNPHFEKMQINVEKIKDIIIDKYSNKDKGII